MDNDDNIFVAVIITCLAFLLGGAIFGSCATRDAIHREAVKQGVAHYEADNEGEVHFVWHPTTKPVEQP